MSMKAARGTKRVCQSCGSKFYDLNRDPITCPMCSTVFQFQESRPKPALAARVQDAEDDEAITPAAPANVEMVSLEEVGADEANIPDLEGDPLVDIDEEEADLGDEDETFIEVEDDDDDGDVTGIVGGSRDEDDEV